MYAQNYQEIIKKSIIICVNKKNSMRTIAFANIVLFQMLSFARALVQYPTMISMRRMTLLRPTLVLGGVRNSTIPVMDTSKNSFSKLGVITEILNGIVIFSAFSFFDLP